MNKLLHVATEQKLTTSINNQYKPVFRNLVLATALKESCWRQFVVKSDKVTYLSSPSGSIGLMQINPYVWRGFYNLDRLRWNIYYNVVAGTEILSHYLLNYAIKSEKHTTWTISQEQPTQFITPDLVLQAAIANKVVPRGRRKSITAFGKFIGDLRRMMKLTYFTARWVRAER